MRCECEVCIVVCADSYIIIILCCTQVGAYIMFTQPLLSCGNYNNNVQHINYRGLKYL